jgi:hypothetical protein
MNLSIKPPKNIKKNKKKIAFASNGNPSTNLAFKVTKIKIKSQRY